MTSKAKPKKTKAKNKKVYRTPWAELLKRVFKYEVNYCDHCGTKLKLIAAITRPSVCQKILKYFNLDTEYVRPQRFRAPPEVEENITLDDYLFNQEHAW